MSSDVPSHPQPIALGASTLVFPNAVLQPTSPHRLPLLIRRTIHHPPPPHPPAYPQPSFQPLDLLFHRLPSIQYLLPTGLNILLILDRKSTRLNSSHVRISY